MVKILTSLLALSATLALSSAHGVHGLEKRAAPGLNCKTAVYKPVPAGSFPTADCTPFPQDPQVQEWLKSVDMKKVPPYPQSKEGEDCPQDLTTIPKDQCWWSCQKCEAPTDITSCPTTGTWGLTFDGK